MRISLLMTAIVLAFAPLTLAAAVEKPNLTSPKEAARAFQLALQKGDADAAMRCALDQPGHREAAAALARASVVIVRLEAASRKRFSTSLESTGNPRVTLLIPDPNGANYATATGDDHFATVTWAGRGKDDPVRVAKVGDEWRVDLTDEKHRTPEKLKEIAAQLEGLQKAMSQLAGDIEAGKFASVQDARYAFLGAVMKATNAQVTVEVKPATK